MYDSAISICVTFCAVHVKSVVGAEKFCFNNHSRDVLLAWEQHVQKIYFLKEIEKMKKSNGGFSLVELIVVIAIMAILAGIAVPTYVKYIDEANNAKYINTLDEIKTAAIAAGIKDEQVEVTEIEIATTTSGDTVSIQSITVKTETDTTGTVISDSYLPTFYTLMDTSSANLATDVVIAAKDTTYATGAIWTKAGGWEVKPTTP